MHILASPGYAAVTITVNVTWMERGSNAGQWHRSIYPSIFNRLQAIARYWSEIATFSYSLAFNALIRGVPIAILGKVLVLIKLSSWGYQAVRQFDDRLSHFDTIPACDRRMDGQPIAITCISLLMHVKNDGKKTENFLIAVGMKIPAIMYYCQ